jgi:hypothetical protein
MMENEKVRLDHSSALRIIVLGYIVRGPIGGLAWHHLQYVTGLARMGHEVLFLEDNSDEPWSCYDPRSGVTGTDASYGLEFTRKVFERVGLNKHWAYYDCSEKQWHGPALQSVEVFCKDADMVLNLSGINPLRDYLDEVPIRAYLDTDPVFTQIRILQDSKQRQLAQNHNVFFSFGENIGSDECGIPNDGFPWQPTRQPIDLNAWPVYPGPEKGAFTTVMQWDSYSERNHDGQHFGMKSESFTPYKALPRSTDVELEIALGSEGAPRQELSEQGWRLRNPLEVTRDPWTYQEYIRHSRGEFSVAKHGYVVSNSGWFSERSACYLASGRPVVVQDTGFTRWLSGGTGLIPFSTPDEALIGLENINVNYRQHSEAARSLAETYFDASIVLSSLIDRAMNKNETISVSSL